jgi:Zn-dependent protease with chaperone function
MRKITKIAALAALLAAPIEAPAQTIDTAAENAFALGKKVGYCKKAAGRDRGGQSGQTGCRLFRNENGELRLQPPAAI